jgi:hypothetical protein
MDFSYNNKSKNSGMFQKEYFLKEFLDLINNKLFFFGGKESLFVCLLLIIGINTFESECIIDSILVSE